jgi:hypothetical protein
MLNDRITQLEAVLGEPLPADLRQGLQEVRPDDDCWIDLEDCLDGREHTIDAVYGLDQSSDDYVQIDAAFGRLNAVLPPGSIPVASVLGGLLVVFVPSKRRSGVYFWDHERDPSDASVELIAPSYEVILAAVRVNASKK